MAVSFFDSRNVQKCVTRIIYLGPLPTGHAKAAVAGGGEGEADAQEMLLSASDTGPPPATGLVTHMPTEAEAERAATRRDRAAERAAEWVRQRMDGRRERFDGSPYREQVAPRPLLST